MKAWIVLLLVASPAMAWGQTDGDAHRSGMLHLADGPLDVVAVLDLYAPCEEEALAITSGLFFAGRNHGFVTVTEKDTALAASNPQKELPEAGWREVKDVPRACV